MSRLPSFSRRCRVAWLAAVACAVLVLPGLSRSQPPSKQQQISELEKHIADLQKKLEELKHGETALSAARPITLADIEAWPGIHGSTLSPDGQWFVYRAGPANGDDEVIVRQTRGDKEYRFPAGKAGVGSLVFSHDSKWLAFSINPPSRIDEPMKNFQFISIT